MRIEVKRKIMSFSFIGKTYRFIIFNLYKYFPKIAVMIEFRLVMGYRLNLKNPQTMNEKIQYLKFYDNTILKTKCADKYEVREYVKSKGLGNILNNIIGIYNSPQEINYNALPEKFVLKNTNGSGCNLIIKNKKDIPLDQINSILEGWMKEEFGVMYYEPQYKGIKSRILCEEYLEDELFRELPDYKVYCSCGNVIMTEVILNRFKNKETSCYHFDKNWNFIEANTSDDSELKKLTKPHNYTEFINICERLSKDFKFVRVDLYIVNNRIYFGELTFTSKGGYDNDFSYDVDKWIGSKIRL